MNALRTFRLLVFFAASGQILRHLHPTPKAALLTAPCCSFISGSAAQKKTLPRASHQIYSLIPSALFLVHIWPCEKKIDGGNDQQSPICNACHVGAGEDESIPCCPTLGSLTSEHNKKKEKEIPASGRR